MLTNDVAVLTSRMLRHGLTYARCFGVVSCRMDGAEAPPKARTAMSRTGSVVVARECYWWHRICIAFRFGWIVYEATFSPRDSIETNEFVRLLRCVNAFSCLVSFIVLLMLQLWYNKRSLIVLNKFLWLHRRIRSLDPSVRGFGGVREFTLLLLKVLCCCFELLFELANVHWTGNVLNLLIDLAEIFMVFGLLMLLHVGFVGFLCVGAFYAEINSYVQRNLCRQLRSLNAKARHGGVTCCPRRLKAIGQQMDECIGIYNDIQKVGRAFERLIALPLCLALLFNVSTLAWSLYFTLMSRLLLANVARWFFALKIFADIVLLTLAANGAVSSPRVVRRLGLESGYVGEDAPWNQNLELFFSRLNIYEYQVRPLGLFEVSNQFILCVVSSLVAYLIFIVQSAIKMHEL